MALKYHLTHNFRLTFDDIDLASWMMDSGSEVFSAALIPQTVSISKIFNKGIN